MAKHLQIHRMANQQLFNGANRPGVRAQTAFIYAVTAKWQIGRKIGHRAV
jgi:hypothetical protein